MNPFPLELAPKRLAEAGKACLGGGIGRVERHADQGDTVGDDYDQPVSAPPKIRERRASQKDVRGQVDRDHRQDFRERQANAARAPGNDDALAEYIHGLLSISRRESAGPNMRWQALSREQ
jgi:hypothetical protein